MSEQPSIEKNIFKTEANQLQRKKIDRRRKGSRAERQGRKRMIQRMIRRRKAKAAAMFCALFAFMSLAGCSAGASRPGGIPQDNAAKESSAEETAENSGTAASSMSESEEAFARREETVQNLLSRMTLKQKIAQMMMPSIRNEHAKEQGGITEISDFNRKAAEYGFGGYIIFEANCKNSEQIANLTAGLQKTQLSEGNGTDIPLLLAIDQEGGKVVRIPESTHFPGNMALGAIGTADSAAKAGDIIGEELAAMGINVDFAPVVDTNTNPNNPVIHVRSFSEDPDLVGELGTAFLKELQSNGIASAVKHFPGHGDTETDSHTGLPRVRKTLEELRKKELRPFAETIAAGTDMVMTAHIQYPEIEKETYVSMADGKEITLPATLSKRVISGVLRDEMKYDGVVVTDSFGMAAIRKHFDLVDAGVLAINAGVDLILNPGDVVTEDNIAEMGDYIEKIAQRVQTGEIPEKRIDESVTRILRLKYDRGILSKAETWKALTEEEIRRSGEEAKKIVGSGEHREEEWELSRKAVTMLKNDAAVPLKDASTVVFCPMEDMLNSVKYAEYRLRESQTFRTPADGSEQLKGVFYGNAPASGISDAIREAEQVILITYTTSKDSMNPQKTPDCAYAHEVIREAHAQGKKVVLISSLLPYDAVAYSDADAILISYGGRGITKLQMESGKEPVFAGQYGMNIPAAIGTAAGMSKAEGKLPVSIPEMNEKFEFTDRILYPIGSGITK